MDSFSFHLAAAPWLQVALKTLIEDTSHRGGAGTMRRKGRKIIVANRKIGIRTACKSFQAFKMCVRTPTVVVNFMKIRNFIKSTFSRGRKITIFPTTDDSDVEQMTIFHPTTSSLNEITPVFPPTDYSDIEQTTIFPPSDYKPRCCLLNYFIFRIYQTAPLPKGKQKNEI